MTYGYHHSKDEIQKRLSRAEGQIRGISKMVDEDKYCIDILTQISAAQSALDKVAIKLLGEHTRHCMAEANPKNREKKNKELMGAVERLLGR